MLPSASGEKMSINMNMNMNMNMDVVSYLPRPSTVDRRWKPNVEVAPNCPRCDSSNTKFCYYNNYSLTQPRYFCKGCRRYWTKGGSLRNVPVGGGCRKNRRGKLVRSRQLMTTSSAPSRQLQGNSVPPDHVLVDNPPIGRGSTGPLSSSTDTSNSDGSAIDLAVLYARFSNNHGGPEFESTAITGASDHQFPVENFHRVEFTGTTNPDYQSTSIAGIDCQIPSLIPTGEVHQLGSGFLQSELDFNFNTGVSCGSQYLIDEGLISTADIFWSGGCSPTTISNSIWQQTSQTQLGFVPPPLEDSSVLLINPNLTNTNWNMFDSSSFEARS